MTNLNLLYLIIKKKFHTEDSNKTNFYYWILLVTIGFDNKIKITLD